MNIDEIMMEIRNLAASQGFYGRLYEQLAAMQKFQPFEWNQVKTKLEAERFDTTLDLVLYFEEGKHCHAKFWKIPVVWESYGVVEVPGDTPEEALEYFNEHQDELGLPEDWSYVEDSFAPSIDNDEELIDMMKILTNK